MIGLKKKLKTNKMDLKEKLVSSFIAFENQVNIDSYVHDIRTEAIKNFENIGFPTKKK
jgi:Fe-S cluster assembly protein SufD